MSGAATPERSGPSPDRGSDPLGSGFYFFWAGHAAGQLSAKSLATVLPLAAVVAFDASTSQVGVLNAALWAPVFLVTLFAGVWLDGRRRRPWLLVAYLASGAVLLAAAGAEPMGWLSTEVLIVTAFTVGCLIAFTDVCAQAFMPELLQGPRLVRGNSRIEATNSLATVAAPGMGGLLVGAVGGSPSLVVIATAYLVAAAAVSGVRQPRPVPASGEQANLVRRIVVGAEFIRRRHLLATLTLQAAWFNLLEQAAFTLYLVFAARSLHFSPAVLGATITVGAVGAVAGSMVAFATARRFGQRTVLVFGMGLASGAQALVPMAGGPLPVAVAVCTASFVLYSFGLTIFNVHAVSLRQAVTPPELISRVSATFRFLAFGAISVGGLVGGFLGTVFDLRTALWVTVAALLAGWLVFSRALHRLDGPGLAEPAFRWSRAQGTTTGPDTPPATDDSRKGLR